MPSQQLVVTSDAIQNVLNGERSEDDAHYARCDVHRSEEHTSELQSLRHLVCRLLLGKKKNDTQVMILENCGGGNSNVGRGNGARVSTLVDDAKKSYMLNQRVQATMQVPYEHGDSVQW